MWMNIDITCYNSLSREIQRKWHRYRDESLAYISEEIENCKQRNETRDLFAREFKTI